MTQLGSSKKKVHYFQSKTLKEWPSLTADSKKWSNFTSLNHKRLISRKLTSEKNETKRVCANTNQLKLT